MAFGLEHPAGYSVLFSTQRPASPDWPEPVPIGPDGRPVPGFGAGTFALLVQAIQDCVTAGNSEPTPSPAPPCGSRCTGRSLRTR